MILNPRKPLCWDVSLTTNGLTLNFDTRKERELVNDTCFKDPVIICLICLVIYCRICQMLVMMCICMCVCEKWIRNQIEGQSSVLCTLGVSVKKRKQQYLATILSWLCIVGQCGHAVRAVPPILPPILYIHLCFFQSVTSVNTFWCFFSDPPQMLG